MFRHRIEAAITNVTDFIYTFRPWQLYDLPEQVSKHMQKFHIYIISKSKKITVSPESLRKINGAFQLEMSIHHKGNISKKLIAQVMPYDFQDMKIVSEYPHNRFQFINNKGKSITWDASLFYAQIIGPCDDTNLEVLYVGQAYGDEGDRGVEDRLVSHSTLQKILAESQRDFSDSDIWISVLSFNPNAITSMNGMINASSSEQEDIERLRGFSSMKITDEHIINFTEAAMIRYFQPHYNKMYKNNFPDPSHKTYQECYQLDLNSIGFELDIPSHPRYFWSESAPPSYRHEGFYRLPNTSDRIKFFDIDQNFPKKSQLQIIMGEE